jgi:hypothetical protein
MIFKKDYRKRPNVQKYLHHWVVYLKVEGREKTLWALNNGKTRLITRKDQIGIIQALGLEE